MPYIDQPYMFATPILFLIFNRPENTKIVFNEIKKQKPKFLFIAADGPRSNYIHDIELCRRAREIVKDIDWECEVKTLFKPNNEGCKYAVSSAIDWFFKYVEEGIILEDDCLPNLTFFSFCAELLKKYRNDNRVMHITGANLNDSIQFGDGSYYYSHYAHIWGWATWRRAWNKYDLELNNVNFYYKLIKSTFAYPSERDFWRYRLKLLKEMNLDTWDYQWMFSIWKENGICLNTNFNLIENIGFGDDSTHTKEKSNYIKTVRKTLVKIKHPSNFKIIEKAESEFIKTIHGFQRKGHIEYFLHRYLFQRILNLHHKLKLKLNRI